MFEKWFAGSTRDSAVPVGGSPAPPIFKTGSCRSSPTAVAALPIRVSGCQCLPKLLSRSPRFSSRTSHLSPSVFNFPGCSIRNPFRMRIDIERVAAQKTNQRLAALAGKLDRQARRRRDCANNRNPRRQRLLHDFKRRPAADHERVPVEGQLAAEKPPADDFVP